MQIQMALSIAASLVLMTCAVRCTSSRSAISSTETKAMNAAHTQGSTSKLAKFSSLLSDASVQAAVTVASIVGGSVS